MNMNDILVLPKVPDLGPAKRGNQTWDYIDETHKAFEAAEFVFNCGTSLLLDYEVEQYLSAEACKILDKARRVFAREFVTSEGAVLGPYPGKTHHERKSKKAGLFPFNTIVSQHHESYVGDVALLQGDPDAPDTLDPNNPESSYNAWTRRDRKEFIYTCKVFTENLYAFLNTVTQELRDAGVKISDLYKIEFDIEEPKSTAVSIDSPANEEAYAVKQNADNLFDTLSEDLADAPEYIKSTFEHFYQEYQHKYVTAYERGFMTKDTAQVFAIQLNQFIKMAVKIILEDIKRGKELSPFKTKSTADTNTSSKTTTDQRKEPRKLKPDKTSVSNSDQQQTESASDADSPSHRFKVTPKKLKFC